MATSRNGLVGERTAANGTRRVNVNFSDEAYDALVELARAKSKTISDVLREAIAFEKWYEETRREGGRVLVERDGKLRELVKV